MQVDKYVYNYPCFITFKFFSIFIHFFFRNRHIHLAYYIGVQEGKSFSLRVMASWKPLIYRMPLYIFGSWEKAGRWLLSPHDLPLHFFFHIITSCSTPLLMVGRAEIKEFLHHYLGLFYSASKSITAFCLRTTRVIVYQLSSAKERRNPRRRLYGNQDKLLPKLIKLRRQFLHFHCCYMQYNCRYNSMHYCWLDIEQLFHELSLFDLLSGSNVFCFVKTSLVFSWIFKFDLFLVTHKEALGS